MKFSIILPLAVFGKETRSNQELLGALSTVQDTLEANIEFSSANLTKSIMDFRLQAGFSIVTMVFTGFQSRKQQIVFRFFERKKE